MNDNIDQLSDSFAAHEHLAPDADDVLVRAHRLARSYHRRRWAVRATGGAVLGAGLVVGSIALPNLGHSSTQSLTSSPYADGGSSRRNTTPTLRLVMTTRTRKSSPRSGTTPTSIRSRRTPA
jgi:hypothetical protein